MKEHLHELLHVAAATLFIVGGAGVLREYRNLRDRVVLAYGAMCLAAAAYAIQVVISHNLPKEGSFWIPWTSAGLVATFGATTLYLLTMKLFLEIRGRVFAAILAVSAGVTAVAVLDLAGYAVTRRSMLFVPVPREGLSLHQQALGESAYTFLPLAEAVAAFFALGFMAGAVYILVHLVRTGSRDVLVYVGVVVNAAFILNDALVAMGAYVGVYLIAFSKSLEAMRIFRSILARSRARFEARLRQAEKMEALGRLAGGIAHDFKNVLFAIGGRLELARESIEDDHPAAEDLDAAADGIQAGRRVVTQLLDLVRSRDQAPEYVEIDAFLAESSSLLSSVVPKGTHVRFDVQARVGGAMVSRGRLTQALMNLVVNAGDAMPEGGVIEVKASAASEVLGRTSRTRASPTIRISVVDEGTGIPEQLLEHVFEPFFTTKAERGGSGLGLATLYTIVDEAGGHIEVESQEGRGTSFHLFLPRVEPPAA